MPQDSLVIAIEEDGLAQVSCILKEAGDAAEGILKAALEEASSLRQARIAGLREDLLKKKASLLSSAGTRMASLMTEARRAAIEGALVEAVESFKDMAREDYGRTLNIFCMELINEWERDKILLRTCRGRITEGRLTCSLRSF
ncbi:MAG: hypothetical protein HZB21_00360 [Deltaproteobacteria bacterium]|nr:hypothetical protein [Deltaproteobacteria bacterium]